MRISDGSSDVFSSDLKSTAAIPAADFAEPVAWAAAGPKTVGAFSAACFYMAQGLRRDLGIPIGAIASDWGGSQARAWLAPGPARRLYGDAAMDLLALHRRDPVAAVTRFAPTWPDWWRQGRGGRENTAERWAGNRWVSTGEYRGTPDQ